MQIGDLLEIRSTVTKEAFVCKLDIDTSRAEIRGIKVIVYLKSL